MSDHLPECPLLEPCDDEVPEHGYCSMQHGVFCIHCHQWCICDRLRACEQRIRQAIVEQLRAEFPKPTLGVQKAIRMVEGS